jgi:hypothetical protein
MKYAIIENNTVVNIAVAEQPLADNWIEAGSAAIGDTYENGQFSKPVPVVDPLAYQAERAAEYPPIGDQLDALWKGGEAAAAMLAQVQAVKAKYPKPE